MTKRIFRSIFLSAVVTMLACVVLILGVLYDHFDNTLKTEMREKAELVAAGVEAQDEGYLKKLDLKSNRITHIAANGRVLYDSAIDVAAAENHADREEFQEAIQSGHGESVRYSGTIGKKTMYYAIALSDKTVIRVATTQNTVWLLMLGILPSIVFVFLLVFVLSLILASLLSKRIVQPLNSMDLDNPEGNAKYDELAPFLRKIDAQKRRITQQMERLTRAQDEFTMITENMREGFLVADKNTDILSFNTAAVRLLSSGDTAVRGKSVFTLNRSAAFRKVILSALHGQSNEQRLTVGQNVYNIMANPVLRDGMVSGVVAVILDVTEQEQREQLRREFTSNVSHELKTPLTSIFGISDMLCSGMVKPKDVSGFAADIKKEAGRLMKLLEDIIRLSQLDENALPVAQEEIDLYELAGSVFEVLEKPAADKHVSLELAGEHCIVMGQATILHELLYNLCENAVKYNHADGFVRVTVDRQENQAVLVVQDSGIGIPPEHIDRVFERFYRVDKSHSKSIGGTGLGLSIVKHAAAYHGGRVQLSSIPGTGTTVTVYLPLNK